MRAFLASLDAEPDRLEEIESELEAIRTAKRRFRCASYDELLARAAEASSELKTWAEEATPPLRPELLPPPGAGRRARVVAGADAKLPPGPSRRPSRRSSRYRPGRGGSSGRAPRAGGRAGRRRRVGVPDRPNRGFRSLPPPRRPPAESCHASRSRSRPLEAARRWSSTRSTPGSGDETAHAVGETLLRLAGSRAGDHDHPPTPDRDARRPALPGREGAGRPDAHHHRGTRKTTIGARSSVGCSAASSSSRRCKSNELRGVHRAGEARPAYERPGGSARSEETSRSSTTRILDRVTAEELLDSGVRVRRQRLAFPQSGRFPNPGPLLLVRGGVRLIDAPGCDALRPGQRRGGP